ncbi:MAG: DUF6703 family protein [Candidatus Phosphoribacter baldrii]
MLEAIRNRLSARRQPSDRHSAPGRGSLRLSAVSLTLRSKVEHASVPWVTRLNRIPRWAAFLGVLALMVAGILVPKVGFLFTVVIALFLAWLIFLTWPRLATPEKLMRLAVLALVVSVAVMQAFPKA